MPHARGTLRLPRLLPTQREAAGAQASGYKKTGEIYEARARTPLEGMWRVRRDASI